MGRKCSSLLRCCIFFLCLCMSTGGMQSVSIFFFNDTATTEIYTRSIVGSVRCVQETDLIKWYNAMMDIKEISENTVKSEHLIDLSLIHISEPTRPLYISYAVFCLKKKKNTTIENKNPTIN
eukprot:TRINITY_DN32722_c0_g1_i1.p1 TRINITY_DN32722_c0_g1~~TRINITY_DN32722_c0_g1_i1.p1  ORF type:complete len:122 (-),score=30.20 TRINITY_DN32722_c0_g1_i1:55-420(-)